MFAKNSKRAFGLASPTSPSMTTGALHKKG